jgi:hypothetical protein
MRQLLDYPFLQPFLALLVIWALCSLVVKAANPKATGLLAPSLIVLGYGFLGMSIGIVAGNSRSDVVSGVLTGVFALYAGLVVYMYGKEAKDSQKLLAGLALVVVPFTLAYGFHTGATYRLEGEARAKEREQWFAKDMEQWKTDLAVYSEAQKKLIASGAFRVSDSTNAKPQPTTASHP